tara:strand:+ start:322 stop:669 length:348 start_codon:yes stop_codon:yes gene_type:complete
MTYHIWTSKIGWIPLTDDFVEYVKKFEEMRPNLFSGERFSFVETDVDRDHIEMYSPSKHFCLQHDTFDTDICRERRHRIPWSTYDSNNFTIIRNTEITNDLRPVKNGHKRKFFKL